MTINQRIRGILSASRDARNSDLELWIIYAYKAGMHLTHAQINVLRDMPSFETIRRTRQKIQENGEYLADPEVEERRYTQFKYVKQNIKSDLPEQVFRDSKGNRYELPKEFL